MAWNLPPMLLRGAVNFIYSPVCQSTFPSAIRIRYPLSFLLFASYLLRSLHFDSYPSRGMADPYTRIGRESRSIASAVFVQEVFFFAVMTN